MSAARPSSPLKDDFEEQQLSFLPSSEHTTEENEDTANFANELEEARR
jgi:hypothetical protein